MEIQTAVAAAEDRAERYRRRAKVAEQHASDWHLVADSQSQEIATLAKQVSAVASGDTFIPSKCCLITWRLLPHQTHAHFLWCRLRCWSSRYAQCFLGGTTTKAQHL